MKCASKSCKNQARPDRKLCQRCADYHTAWQRKNREKGLCHCGKPRVEGKTACEKHLAGMVQYMKRRRENRKAKGLCIECGKPREFQQVHCLSCGQKYRKGEALPILRARRESAMQEKARQQAAHDQALADFLESRLHLITNPRTVEIVKSRHIDKQTLEEIGHRLKLSRERVRQIQAKADEVLFTDVLVADKSAEAVECAAQRLKLIGLLPQTAIRRSTTGREFYQFLQRA